MVDTQAKTESAIANLLAETQAKKSEIQATTEEKKQKLAALMEKKHEAERRLKNEADNWSAKNEEYKKQKVKEEELLKKLQEEHEDLRNSFKAKKEEEERLVQNLERLRQLYVCLNSLWIIENVSLFLLFWILFSGNPPILANF